MRTLPLCALRWCGEWKLRTSSHTEPAPRSGWRRPISRLIGRERDLERIVQLLSEHRLVSLVGPGGVGKTRLALEAIQLPSLQAGGPVTVIELEGVSDGAVLADLVAASCDVHLQPGVGALDGLVRALGVAPRLLVLDNCEHLVEAVAALAMRVLDATESVRVLLTTREALNVSGEAVFPVPPLSVPDLGKLPREVGARAGVVEKSGAVQLFVERARQVLPDFALDERNAASVAEICVMLDGLPLPIELAVAQLDLYLPEQLARQLDARLDLLTRAPRGAVPRHQSLRALIQSSTALLDEVQQTLYRRVGVFQAPFSVAAVQVVCADDDLAPELIPGLLLDLVRRSLIQPLRETADDGSGRALRMLESIRAYARERLTEAPECDSVRHRHLLWLVSVARELEPTLWDRGVASALARLDRVLPDLRAALLWARASAESADRALGLELAGLLWRYWELRGLHQEAAGHIEALLEPAIDESEGRVRALAALGFFLALRGNPAGMFARMSEAAELGRRLPFSRPFGFVLVASAFNAIRFGQQDVARGLAEELMAADAGLLTERIRGWALYVEGFRHRAAERFDAAKEVAAESYRILSAVGDTWDVFVVSHLLGVLALRLGDTDGAEQHARTAMESALRLETGWAVAACAELFSWIRCEQGAMPAAALCMLLAERLRDLTGALLFPEDQIERGRYAPRIIEAVPPERLAALRAATDRLEYRESVDAARGVPGDELRMNEIGDDPHGLTARELEIVSLIGQGLRSPQIADRLVLARKTVDTHVDHIRRKLALRSRSQIAAWWVARMGRGSVAEPTGASAAPEA